MGHRKQEEALLHSMHSDQRQAEGMQPAAGMLMHRMEGKRPLHLTTMAYCLRSKIRVTLAQDTEFSFGKT